MNAIETEEPGCEVAPPHTPASSSNMGLCCPKCRSSNLRTEPGGITCCTCGIRYPVVELAQHSIPWLYADPASSAAEWQARRNGFLVQQQAKVAGLEKALTDTTLSDRTRQRLRHRLRRHECHVLEVERLLEPFGFLSTSIRQRLGSLPKAQNLSGYWTNVFRDWSWETAESEALAAPLLELLTQQEIHDIGRVLCIGGGAGRIPYDVAVRLDHASLTCLDLNPLLTHIAAQMFAGETVELTEFPLAPLGASEYAVTQRCEATHGPLPARFVVGDFTQPPFPAHAFDCVVTPWLIDILPIDLAHSAAHFNEMLELEGLWLNTGSLAFMQGNPAHCYEPDDIEGLLAGAGFELVTYRFDDVPYLQSPYSGHGRVERIYSFCARKKKHKDPVVEATSSPNWLTDTVRPIEQSIELVGAAADLLLRAQILSAVDGHRSVDQISSSLARHHELDPVKAKQVVLDVLSSFTEGSVPFMNSE